MPLRVSALAATLAARRAGASQVRDNDADGAVAGHSPGADAVALERFTIAPDDYHLPYAGTAEDGRKFFLSDELFNIGSKARTGHGTFVDLYEVQVDFTIYDDQTDVRVVDLGEDPGCEFRIVGDTEYDHARRYELLDDGQARVHNQWVALNLNSTRKEDRYVVVLGRAKTGIGTPSGLIAGILDDGYVVVVASDEQTTTYECLIRASAGQQAAGDFSTLGFVANDPGRKSRIVVDAAGLPASIELKPEDPLSQLRFQRLGLHTGGDSTRRRQL